MDSICGLDACIYIYIDIDLHDLQEFRRVVIWILNSVYIYLN